MVGVGVDLSDFPGIICIHLELFILVELKIRKRQTPVSQALANRDINIQTNQSRGVLLEYHQAICKLKDVNSSFIK